MGTPNMFYSQMSFLGAYSTSYYKRRERAEEIEDRLNALQPQIEEANRLKEELAELKKSNRDDEKFLISMNNQVERTLGTPIDQGPLFNQTTETEQKEKECEADGKN